MAKCDCSVKTQAAKGNPSVNWDLFRYINNI